MKVKNYKKCYLYHPFLSIRNLDIKIVFVKPRPAVGEYTVFLLKNIYSFISTTYYLSFQAKSLTGGLQFSTAGDFILFAEAFVSFVYCVGTVCPWDSNLRHLQHLPPNK